MAREPGASVEDQLVRQPVQERSRLSLDRAVEAATALLAERGSAAFTLADVATRSGVSTGSIYARVASKDDLIRVAHARTMERLAVETAQVFGEPLPGDGGISAVVDEAVRRLASLLQRHAPVLGPFMVVALGDPAIAVAGKAAYEGMVGAFADLVLSARGEIGHADADAAVDWACTVTYSVLARQLGLDSGPEAAVPYAWDDLVANLRDMVLAYLTAGAPPPEE